MTNTNTNVKLDFSDNSYIKKVLLEMLASVNMEDFCRASHI